MAKMTDDELRAIVDAEVHDAMGYVGGELTDQRRKAMDYFLGEPFGNEVEGRSQVVITEVADVIGWIMPGLVKIFAGSDEVVRFDAEEEGDEEAAQEETEALNHVFYKKNPGFLILYTWFQDALLQKNGYVKIYWEESEKVTKETYNGLTDAELAQLMEDSELEPVEHTQYEVTEMVADPMTGQVMPVMAALHDIVFKRTRKAGCIKIDPVPPEEMLVSRKTYSVFPSEAPFVAHRTKKTASELIEAGYDRSIVESLPSYDGNDDTNEEEESRYHLSDENPDLQTSTVNKSMREIMVTEAYLYVDYDGDGIAELRKITRAGDKVLDNEEVDRIPFACLTPYILSHKHIGQSVADLVKDLQLVKSTVMRNILDNFYLINNSRTVVNESVNLDDLLTSRPGGIIRTRGVPGQDVVPLITQPIGTQGFDMLNVLDQIKESRTGVSRNMMGMNQDISNDTAHGMERLMSAAEQKVELIARVFAETGVKDLFMQMHELMRKYGQAMALQLKTGWKNVDPTEWRDRNDMSIKVGLGTGDRTRMQQALGGVLSLQERIAATGGMGILVNLKNIYKAATDFARYSGLPTADPYFTDPETPEAQAAMNQPPPPDPNMEMIKMQGQIEQLKAQLKAQEDSQKYEIEMAKLQQKFAEMDQRFIEKMTELELQHKQNVPGSAV